MITKTEANYVDGPVKVQPCKRCSMWRMPRNCTLVKGTIKPVGRCDRWEPEEEKL